MSLKFKGCSFASPNVPHNNRLVKGTREQELPFNIPGKRSYGAIVTLWANQDVTHQIINIQGMASQAKALQPIYTDI